MAAERDYYEILGISRDADEREIKKAYRKLAKKYHPDTNSGNEQSEKKFKEITEAYSVLGDQEKKEMYDRFGHAAFEGGTQGNNPGKNVWEQDADDIFGDFWGGMFGGRRFSGFWQNDFPKRGTDLQSEISVSFEEAALGCVKVIHLQNGIGIWGTQSVQVQIPAGIDDGMSIRLKGKGMPGTGGAKAGDLFLKVHITERPGFVRKGLDIYTSAEIPSAIAREGGKVRMQTVDGNVECQIKKGIRPGARIRLKGKGIVSVKNHAVRGDQYVTILVDRAK